MNQESKSSVLPWESHYDNKVPLQLNYPEGTLDALLRNIVEKYPQETAIIFLGFKMSYTELGNSIERLAVALSELGINPGDRVALLLPNCPQYVIGYYAILTIGGIVVPVNPLSTETELLHIFRDAEVRVVISLDLFADKVENVRDSCHRSEEPHLLEHTFYTALNEYMPFPLKHLYPFTRKLSAAGKERLEK